MPRPHDRGLRLSFASACSHESADAIPSIRPLYAHLRRQDDSIARTVTAVGGRSSAQWAETCTRWAREDGMFLTSKGTALAMQRAGPEQSDTHIVDEW
ncbi:protein of unknown function [Microbacterium sp. Nx66]|nr:protein of unknown function [Microbacterium sp. Nx66]